MKTARLAFAIKYRNWTIKDWKQVIWTDEASVVLGQKNVCIWRTIEEGEQRVTATSREQYIKGTEFMFWECFSWDYKGPCHCWK